MEYQLTKFGKHYRWSKWLIIVLALIIEKVTGLEFDEYLQKNIFDVCDMNSEFIENIFN